MEKLRFTKPLTLLFFLFVCSTLTFGQRESYSTAVGLRGGWSPAFTIKHFVGGGNTAIEGMISGWPYGVTTTVLGEVHVPMGAPGLNFYYGGGAHVRFYRHYYTGYSYWPWPYRDREYVTVYERGAGLGIDGIVGIEYKIPPIPLALSLDFKPFLEFGRDYWFAVPDLGLGIKLAF